VANVRRSYAILAGVMFTLLLAALIRPEAITLLFSTPYHEVSK
jgi:hypothetical protein